MARSPPLRFNILSAENAGNKVRFALIGCGGRGISAHLPGAKAEQFVAAVDVDEGRHITAKKWHQSNGGNPDELQVFTDYRRMFDKVGKGIDAVFIAAPNHHHALPALIAMQLGKDA